MFDPASHDLLNISAWIAFGNLFLSSSTHIFNLVLFRWLYFFIIISLSLSKFLIASCSSSKIFLFPFISITSKTFLSEKYLIWYTKLFWSITLSNQYFSSLIKSIFRLKAIGIPLSRSSIIFGGNCELCCRSITIFSWLFSTFIWLMLIWFFMLRAQYLRKRIDQ